MIEGITPRRLLTWTLFSIVFCGCLSEKEYIIESDYSYDGNFRRYKTFDFAKNASLDTIYNYELMQKTMQRRLNAQGYVKSEKKPDLVITYKIFYNDFSLNGFDQPSFNNWIGEKAILQNDPSSGVESVGGNVPLANRRERLDASSEYMEEKYTERTYQMNKGTLFVAFYDRRRKKTIWQGYASGIFARSDIRLDRNINAAASKIFDEFRLIANGFLLK